MAIWMSQYEISGDTSDSWELLEESEAAWQKAIEIDPKNKVYVKLYLIFY
jgi:hypothetical protein